jgi:hypothetical protein
MNNTAPTFAKQDSLKFLELSTWLTVTSKKTTFRKQEIGDYLKNNNSLFRFFHLTFNFNTWHAIWAHLLLTIVMELVWQEWE